MADRIPRHHLVVIAAAAAAAVMQENKGKHLTRPVKIKIRMPITIRPRNIGEPEPVEPEKKGAQ